ncbi:MAG: hypothetical protein QM778_03275 [Myxococcales bacterium]
MRLSRALAVLVAALAASCAHKPPAPLAQSADGLLGVPKTRFGLSSYFLVPEPRCSQITPGSELCDFRLGKNNPGYRELAEAVGTRQKVSVLCLLPLPRGEQAAGSCSVHRHDGDELKLKYQNDSRWWTRRAPRTPEQQQVFDELRASAHSAFDLSRYFGQAPDQCVLTTASTQCYWTLTTSTPGYERSLLATRLTEPFHPPRAKLHVTCSMPSEPSGADASERCLARIGDDPELVEKF